MKRRTTTHELSMHDIVQVEIAHNTGHSGAQWLTITCTSAFGQKTDLAVWGVEDEAPELILEHDVPLRRVQTIGEGE